MRPRLSCLLLTSLALMALAKTALAQTREQAVAAARDGRLEEAISTLRALIAAGDTSPGTAYDLAVILSRAKRPQEATDLFERTDTPNVPEYVLLAMTRAYWDQRDYPQAENLARRGLASFPANKDWIKLSGLIPGEEADRSSDPYTALRYYGGALRQLPEDADLQKAVAGLLSRLGAPYAAASVGGPRDIGLEAQQAGLMVRWGAQVRSIDPALRFAGTDAALARLDALIAEAVAAQPQDTGLITRLRRDRVVGLRDRERWAEAVAQADELRRGGDRLTPYVRQAEADALLALRRPGEARVAYQEVIEAQPQNQAAKIGRFFTEVEEEDFDAAFATVDAIAADQKQVTYTGDGSQPLPNPSWLGDEITAAVARNYAGIESQAWQRLYYLSEQAPGLGYLRAALGSAARARGWPRRAAEEVEIAATLSPLDLGGQVALADSSLWLKQYGEARKRAEGLAVLYPENLAVQRLVRDVGLIDRWEFQTQSSSYNEGKGLLAPNSPGSGFDTVNRIYTPLLDNQFRIVGGFDYMSGRPREGFIQRYRQGGGIEWRRPFLTIEADGWANTGVVHRGGASLSAQWVPTDHWNFGLQAELFSTDAPLRALYYGITANKLAISAGYDWHESTGWAAIFRQLNFSDGNRRSSGDFRFVQKILNRPHLNITARPEVYGVSNTKPNAPYFNPSLSFSIFGGIDADHIIWRHYERSFHQHISAGAGTYWQQGHGAAPMASVTYEQILGFSASTDLRYGASYNRRVYDGAPVNSLTFSLLLERRF
jgi:biofilm PGA synthesis protein PgaA